MDANINPQQMSQDVAEEGSKRTDILVRQAKVRQLIAQGFKASEIAASLGANLRTVERDIIEIRQGILNEINNSSIVENAFVDFFIKNDELQKEAWEQYRSESIHNETVRLGLLKLLCELSTKKIEVLKDLGFVGLGPSVNLQEMNVIKQTLGV